MGTRTGISGGQHRRRAVGPTTVATGLLLLLMPIATARSAPGEITEFPLPAKVGASAIAAGPEGALWFTEFRENGPSGIGRITTQGAITELPLPEGTRPGDIAGGPDGALWFTDFSSGTIGRITPAGQITEFALPGSPRPRAIVNGPDGALWFTEGNREGQTGHNAIGRITTAGQVTERPIPSDGEPSRIAVGPDGNLWFTARRPGSYANGEIGRVTPLGEITEFPLPGPPKKPVAGEPYEPGKPLGIAAGPDGNVWFTISVGLETIREEEYVYEGRIGRISPAGEITEFRVPAHVNGNYPREIVSGPDGHLWFTAPTGSETWGYRGDGIDAISPGGHVTEFPNGASRTTGGLALGPEGGLWFTAVSGGPSKYFSEEISGAIGRVTTGLTEVDISPARLHANGHWTKLRLTCISGGVACRGKVRLRRLQLRKGRGVLAGRRYRLAPGSTRDVALDLSPRARAALAREGVLYVEAEVVVGEGERTSRHLVLKPRLRRPRNPR